MPLNLIQIAKCECAVLGPRNALRLPWVKKLGRSCCCPPAPTPAHLPRQFSLRPLEPAEIAEYLHALAFYFGDCCLCCQWRDCRRANPLHLAPACYFHGQGKS